MSKYLDYNHQVSNLKDGFYDLEKDYLALKSFLEEVKELSYSFDSYEEKLKYLIDNDFLEDFLNSYSLDDILSLHELVEKENFSFHSFMSARKFYQDYALKTNDKKYYLETYADRIKSVSLSLGQGDINLAKEIAFVMIKGYYQPATPTFLNAGKKRRGEFVSCFLLDIDDSLNSISFNLGQSMYLSKIGGGVALNLTSLRARGENIKDITKVSKGVVPVLKLLEDAFDYADQMGQRKGAGACYLNIFHYDIEEFLDTKKINADEKSRIQTLSLGVIIPDKFLQIAKENKPFYVFGPQSVQKEMGKSLEDIDINLYYEDMINNPNIYKKELNARDLLTNLAKLQFESGYPYLIFIDEANRRNPLKGVGTIGMSNLCTEIFQIQKRSLIRDYDEENELGYDISCVLGSLNLVNIVENGALEIAVEAGMKALTAVSEMTSLTNAPTLKKANEMFHSVGLGAMNLHGLLIRYLVGYESEEAKEIVSGLFSAINFYSLRTSMLISEERGRSFEGFELSDYKNGSYFNMYLEKDFSPKSEKSQKALSKVKVPTPEDWEKLKGEVASKGLYHAYRLAIAPTQSISYLQNATSSIFPIVDKIETRTYGNSTTYYPAPYLTRENALFYKTAFQTDMKKMIDIVSEVQLHIDQGISCVLYIDDSTSTRDLVKLYLYAHKKGLKSLYYTRSRNLTVEECLSCAT